MTRDLQLLRALLLAAEEKAPIGASELVSGVANEQVMYHVNLLREAGYLDFVDKSTLRAPRIDVIGLTWKGHETAGLIRDESRWQDIMRRIGVASVPFDLVERLAHQLASQALELHDVRELTTSN